MKSSRPSPEALDQYLDTAMSGAVYEVLADGSVAGEIPAYIGVVAFSSSRAECEKELRSVLEGWVLLGLELGHELPVQLRQAGALAAGRG